MRAIVATNEPPERDNDPFDAANLFMVFFPLLIMAIPLFFAFRYMKRSRKVSERFVDHMARMEEKTDRVVALLESIRDERPKA